MTNQFKKATGDKHDRGGGVGERKGEFYIKLVIYMYTTQLQSKLCSCKLCFFSTKKKNSTCHMTKRKNGHAFKKPSPSFSPES